MVSRRAVRVLANAQSFAVFDSGGDIFESPRESLGFFHRDTRYLSRFEITIAGHTPYLLDSNLDDDNAQLRINLTNPDLFKRSGRFELPRDSIQMERSWVLANGALLPSAHDPQLCRRAGPLSARFVFRGRFCGCFRSSWRQAQASRPALLKPTIGAERDHAIGIEDWTKFSAFTEITFHTIPKRLGEWTRSFRARPRT